MVDVGGLVPLIRLLFYFVHDEVLVATVRTLGRLCRECGLVRGDLFRIHFQPEVITRLAGLLASDGENVRWSAVDAISDTAH